MLEAANAEEAFRQMETHEGVRLLFTDINVPGKLDGLELAEEVHRRWPHVLLIITSGRETPSEEQIPDDGRFVPKPYSDADVMAEVNDLFGTTKD